MCALACMMKNLGYEVKGSDISTHFFIEDGLNKCDIEVLSYNKDNLKNGMKIVKGASIKDDNPEIIEAKRLNLDIYLYNEMVGKLTEKFKTICVADCHSKTTTTSMLSLVLNELKGCNFLIGDGTGYATKGNYIFILKEDLIKMIEMRGMKKQYGM